MDLLLATEAQACARDAATWAAWGGALSPGDYLALLLRLRKHPWPREAMTTWLLVDPKGETVASCQAYRTACRLRGVPGNAYGLGSVFVDPAQRGQGLASQLLERLAARLTAEDPAAQACFLFAEAGATAYMQAGFQDRPTASLAFSSRPGDASSVADGLILETELPGDEAALAWPAGPFALHPSPAQLDWHLERERILLGVTGGMPPPLRGARAGRGLALWAVDPTRQALTFLCFQAPSPAEASTLLEAARRTADACGLSQVLLWDAGEAPPSLQAEGTALNGALRPMLRPLTGAFQAADWTTVTGATRI
ncbi:MAG: GNAT family N-acetyltransferase [Acidobacteriota bacterium]|nr:GNAT family N-acetyltransferase [Acidobacteriota bacterium]